MLSWLFLTTPTPLYLLQVWLVVLVWRAYSLSLSPSLTPASAPKSCGCSGQLWHQFQYGLDRNLSWPLKHISTGSVCEGQSCFDMSYCWSFIS